MKKIHKYLLLFLIAAWMWQLPANSAPVGVNETGGLGAGMINQLQRDGSGVYDTMQKDQIKRFNVEKNLISPVEKIQTTEDEDKFEVDIQRDLSKINLIPLVIGFVGFRKYLFTRFCFKYNDKFSKAFTPLFSLNILSSLVCPTTFGAKIWRVSFNLTRPSKYGVT